MKRCHQRGLSSQSHGKYWQLNQSNQHTSTYSRIQQQTKSPYYATIHNEYTQENLRINRQDRQKVTFPGSAYPKEIPNSALPLHTQKQCTAIGSSWGLPYLSLTTEGSWIHLGGRVAKPLVSPLMTVPPIWTWKIMFCIQNTSMMMMMMINQAISACSNCFDRKGRTSGRHMDCTARKFRFVSRQQISLGRHLKALTRLWWPQRTGRSGLDTCVHHSRPAVLYHLERVSWLASADVTTVRYTTIHCLQ